MGSNKNS